MKAYNPIIFLVALSMLVTGFCGLIAEYLLATTASFILGNSIEQFTVTIALMFLSMAAGSFLQQFIREREVLAFVYIELLLSILIGFSAMVLYSAYAWMDTHFYLIQYLLTGLIGLLIGFEAPLIARIIEKENISLKVNLSIVLSLDAIGGAVAGYVWIKHFLGKVELMEIGFWLGGLNLAVALLSFVFFARRRPELRHWLHYSSIMWCVVLLIGGLRFSPGLRVNLEQRLYYDKIVFSKTTPYQHLTLTHNPKLDEYRLYINGQTQFASRDEHIYHENLVHPIMEVCRQTGSIRKVLVLGGGDGMAVREVKKYPQVEQITLVDLDPEMTQLAATHPVLKNLNDHAFEDARLDTLFTKLPASGEERSIRLRQKTTDHNGQPVLEEVARVQLVHKDAYTYVRDLIQAQKQYDLIIIDLPDPDSEGLAKLYSKVFFRQLLHILRPDGCLVSQSTSPFHAPKAFGCILKTMESAGLQVVPYHDNVPSFGDWGWLIATPSRRFDLREKLVQIQSFSAGTRHLSPAKLQSNLVFGKDTEMRFRDSTIEENTLMRPVLLHYYLKESWQYE